jgi:hypothetical protein
MTACGAGGDVAGVEDVQVQAQVGQVEVHYSNLWICVVWMGAFAGKPAPTGDAIHCGSELARDGDGTFNIGSD